MPICCWCLWSQAVGKTLPAPGLTFQLCLTLWCCQCWWGLRSLSCDLWAEDPACAPPSCRGRSGLRQGPSPPAVIWPRDRATLGSSWRLQLPFLTQVIMFPIRNTLWFCDPCLFRLLLTSRCGGVEIPLLSVTEEMRHPLHHPACHHKQRNPWKWGIAAHSPHPKSKVDKTGDMFLLHMFFLIYFLQTSKKSSKSSRRLVWMSKEFLSKLRHIKEAFKRWRQGMMADGMKSCPIIQGWG